MAELHADEAVDDHRVQDQTGCNRGAGVTLDNKPRAVGSQAATDGQARPQ